jgi:hypothetical protein
VSLAEVGGCIFDEKRICVSRGHESLDPVAREAYVNHLHLAGPDRVPVAWAIIESWAAEMRIRWTQRTFRIYRQTEADEITIRFHAVRPGLPNWCEDGIEIITISGTGE